MLEVILTYSAPKGSREIPLTGERLSIGRGGDADEVIADQGLSRLHATIYREGNRVWIVDENSSNGTFVNGSPVNPGGSPLQSGDRISIGNETVLHVRIAEARAAAQPPPAAHPMATATTAPASSGLTTSILPVALIAGAIFLVSVTAVFIVLAVFTNGSSQAAQNTALDFEEDFDEPIAKTTPFPEPKPTEIASTVSSVDDIGPISNADAPPPTNPDFPSGKKYLDMTETEKRAYIADRSMRLAQVIGNRDSGEIPSEAIDRIKSFTDAYARRANVKPIGGCRFGDNLQVTYERASKNAPFIVRAFNEKGIDPRIGIYLAMIESEHCVCLQSPTGPLGMFQFAFATAKTHFDPSEGVIRGASPSNPDDRCKPEPSARAAASYMKALTGRFGTGPASVPLAIGSYNSGEGGLSSNLVKALQSGSELPRDFWTLISKGDILSAQFQSENFKYVPKFFGAAIVGENPQDFGLTLQPLSTYTK
ncbi:MAG: FHA domain-containing protein [Blastocatellia bacterium]|nr:FHA domain-containing protein [Blastocatellia bacterium]